MSTTTQYVKTLVIKTTAAIVALFYNLFLRPEVAQRVFEEIQSVTHGERLPNVADRSSLLYTDAVFKESVRIRSFMPLGKLSLGLTDNNLIYGQYFRSSTCQRWGRDCQGIFHTKGYCNSSKHWVRYSQIHIRPNNLIYQGIYLTILKYGETQKFSGLRGS